MVCTAGLNINDYVKCSIESTFQNKLLFCQHNEAKCTFQVLYGLNVWDFHIWFFKLLRIQACDMPDGNEFSALLIFDVSLLNTCYKQNKKLQHSN